MAITPTDLITDEDYWPFHDEEEMPDTPVHIRTMGYLAAVLK